MSECCNEFTSTTDAATRTPNPKLMPLDECNNKHDYLAVAGAYEWGMPVRPTANPNEVEPAPDGVDAIGISTCSTTAVAGDKITIARTGRLRWSDMAAGIGQSPTDQAAWWAVHVELAKLNIYVEFS